MGGVSSPQDFIVSPLGLIGRTNWDLNETGPGFSFFGGTRGLGIGLDNNKGPAPITRDQPVYPLSSPVQIKTLFYFLAVTGSQGETICNLCVSWRYFIDFRVSTLMLYKMVLEHLELKREL